MTRTSRSVVETAKCWAAPVAWLAAIAYAHRNVFAITPDASSLDPVEDFFFDTTTTLPALHAALFVLVLYRRRNEIARAMREGGHVFPALLVAALGLAFLAWSRISRQPDLQIDAFVLLVLCAGLALGGRRLLSRLVLPIALIYLARPLPPVLTHALHESLQRFAGSFAQNLLSPVFPLERSGHILWFQDRVFQVIEGCSGLRLEITLLTATLLYAAFISRSRRQTLGILAIAALLGPLLNGLRVVSIMLNPNATVAEVHSAQGLLFVALGIVAVASLDRVLERADVWPADAPDQAELDGCGRATAVQTIFLAAVAVAAVITSVVEFDAPSKTRRAWAIHEISSALDGWKRTRTLELDRRFYGTTRFGNKLYWEYMSPNSNRVARVLVATDDRRRRDRSGLSPKSMRIGPEWEIIESIDVERTSPPYRATRMIQRSPQGRAVSLHYRIGDRGLLRESLRWYFALDSRAEPIPVEILTVRIDVPIDERTPGRAHTDLARLEAAVAEILDRARPHL